jgi:alpha-galactosidase
MLTDCTLGPNAATFTCTDAIAELTLTVNIKLSESGVLQIQEALCNDGSDDLQMLKLAPTMPLPSASKELLTFYGRWTREFQQQRLQVDHGDFIQEARVGRTSHEHFPGMMIGRKGFSDEFGEVYGFHLGWSGNHTLRAGVKADGKRFFQASELLLPGELKLGQGETYNTPSLYCAHSEHGLNGISDSFHPFVRKELIHFRNGAPRPVHLNTWEGIYFDHKPAYIMEMASEAAKMGVERFIIDDGWFKGRNDDTTSLGDWYLDETKYPDGLDPVIKHVNDLGMEFGIWFEPEMVNKDSDLYRAHPDWLLELPGYEQPTGRWQYVLDLLNPACFQYLFDRISTILSRYNVGYVKWDHNRELVQAGHNGTAAVHGQTLQLYALIDALNKSHPKVEIESCSSGGGRIDYEVLKRTQRFWCSDSNDALERQTIQKNMGYFFPPEVMGAHVGPKHCHTTGRVHDIKFRASTALSGHFGVELDPLKTDDAEKAAFSKYIALHKRFRTLLHSGRTFRVDAEDTKHVYGVRDATSALVFVSQLAMPDYTVPEPIQLRFLKPSQMYRVELVDYPSDRRINKEQPLWITEQKKLEKAGADSKDSLVLSGQALAVLGLPLPVLDPESSALVYITEVGTPKL